MVERNILGIVGAEAAKFTGLGRQRAIEHIYRLIALYEPGFISSGRCHLGGVDGWAEQVGKLQIPLWDDKYIFPATHHRWSGEGGYEQRNIRIAHAATRLVCITVRDYPESYPQEERRWPTCYHCARYKRYFLYGEFPGHVKSGGCWTMHLARQLGKPWELIVVDNNLGGQDGHTTAAETR